MSAAIEAEVQDLPTIHQAHDNFFIRSLSDLRVAKDFLRQHLPSTLLESLELDSVEICKDKWIHINLKPKMTDILYKLKLKDSDQETYISTLIEHQSTPQKQMPLRALYYESIIMYNHWNNYKTVPLVYTIVYYNGKEDWNYSKDIKDIINAPEHLVERYALKPFQLVELNKIADEVLRQHQWSGVMGLAMKHIYDRDILPVLRNTIGILRDLEYQEGHDFVLTLLYYIHEKGEVSDEAEFQSLIDLELSQEIGEKTMTLAERYTQKGFNQGISQGIHQGEATLFIRQLQCRFGQVPESYLTQIKKADAQILLSWGEKILDAKSLEEIFEN